MAIANLHETLLSYTLRKNQLNLEISNFQAQKQLAIYSQADAQSLKSSKAREIRDIFRKMYEDDPSLHEKYIDYTKIPEFEAEIERINAELQDQLDELTAWETAIDAQITTDSAELEEINAYVESVKSMLSSNIQEDFNFGLD